MSGRLEERLVFSNRQYRSSVAAISVCAASSVLCSSLIIYVAIRRLKRNTKFPVQQRLLLLLGILDIIFSLGLVGGHFLSPDGRTPMSFGTIETCTVQGAMTHIGTMGTQLCNMFLAFYYCLTVNYGKKTKDLKCWEYTWFSTILGWPFLLVGGALYLNNFGLWEGAEGCFFGGTYPLSCDLHPDVECERGDGDYRFLIWGLMVITFLMASFCCFVFTFMVWFAYKRLIRQSSQYNFAGTATNRNHRLASEVTRQTLLYSSVYFNMILWTVTIQFINPVVLESSAPFFVKYSLHLISNVFLVMSGVFNCAAYMRPSYNRWKRAFPYLSAWELLWNAVENENPPRGTSYNIPTGETAESGRGRPSESDTLALGSGAIQLNGVSNNILRRNRAQPVVDGDIDDFDHENSTPEQSGKLDLKRENNVDIENPQMLNATRATDDNISEESSD